MKKISIHNKKGFTLVELMVVISVIAILSSIVYANFGEARAIARDDVRMTQLKEMELAIRLYKAENGAYPMPAASCTGGPWFGPGPNGGSTNFSTCNNYVSSLVPDFIPALPLDPKDENVEQKGFYYRSDGTDYKLMAFDVAEAKLVNDEAHKFARCPDFDDCGGSAGNRTRTYAVYSPGAADW